MNMVDREKAAGLVLISIAAMALSVMLAGCGQSEPSQPVSAAPDAATQVDATGQAIDAYPLKTCVVSGEELGGMGETVKVTHDAVEVHLCCKNCVEQFNKDPDKYVAMVRAGSAASPQHADDHAGHDH